MLPTSAPLSELTKYVWNSGSSARQFCPVCGTVLLWTGQGGPPLADRMGINVHVLDDVDADAIPITKFDGKKIMPGKSPLEKEAQQ